MKTLIGLVEDDSRYAEALLRRLNTVPGFRCVGAWPTAEATLRELPHAKPEVLLVDLELPYRPGTELIREVNERFPGVRSLVLTKFDNPEQVFGAVRAGAHGYVLKSEPFSRIASAIREVQGGGCPMTPHIARMTLLALREMLPDTSGTDKLTPRERQILELLSTGRSYRQIAAELGCTYDTVRAHFNHIYDKLHVHSRTEAVAKFQHAKRLWPGGTA